MAAVAATVFAKVDAARQLSHHHKIGAQQDIRFDGRGIDQRRQQLDGAQIGKEPQRLANAQQPLLRTHGGGRVVPAGAPNSAQEHRFRLLTDRDGRLRQRVTSLVDGHAAN